MANDQNHICCCIFFLVAIFQMLSHGGVEGRHVVVQKNLDSIPKGTIKTIESEDGDVIDCVDFYKQPAFDHPLIKDLQMEPSSYPSGMMKMDDSQPELIQNWHKNGDCPEGTIPIRRTLTLNHDYLRRTSPFRGHGGQFNHSMDIEDPLNHGHEYAQVTDLGSVYYGAQAIVNVWNPKTEGFGEFSLSQIWVLSTTDEEETTNTVEVGWIVCPGRYGDNQTRFFVYWTSDNYQSTGCYDLSCPGFVQTHNKVAIGSPIAPVSTYNQKSFEISINIYKDNNTGNWWLEMHGMVLGYWPHSIIPGLANGGLVVSWGGEITDAKFEGHHTTTQMGSGHFPSEGYGKSSFFRNLGVIDTSGTRRDPGFLQIIVSNPACYDVHLEKDKGAYGTHFLYGGPGYSPKCP